jgi:hypothetical protein
MNMETIEEAVNAAMKFHKAERTPLPDGTIDEKRFHFRINFEPGNYLFINFQRREDNRIWVSARDEMCLYSELRFLIPDPPERGEQPPGTFTKLIAHLVLMAASGVIDQRDRELIKQKFGL